MTLAEITNHRPTFLGPVQEKGHPHLGHITKVLPNSPILTTYTKIAIGNVTRTIV